MTGIKQLIAAYAAYIGIPWRPDAAPPERVVFCVHDEAKELRLRARIDEFEMATRRAGHGWARFDLTDTFADWMTAQKYAESYFQKPHLLPTLMHRYLEFIVKTFEAFIEDRGVEENEVVAVMGAGSLFGFLKVKDVVDRLAPLVPGKLVVFFPGSRDGNNYRLLDAYDGWNYLAVPITADREF